MRETVGGDLYLDLVVVDQAQRVPVGAAPAAPARPAPRARSSRSRRWSKASLKVSAKTADLRLSSNCAPSRPSRWKALATPARPGPGFRSCARRPRAPPASGAGRQLPAAQAGGGRGSASWVRGGGPSLRHRHPARVRAGRCRARVYFFSASRISRSSSTSSGVGAGGRGRRRGLALQAVDLLDHHEDDEGQDDEVDRDGDEVAVGEHRAGLLGLDQRRSAVWPASGMK